MAEKISEVSKKPNILVIWGDDIGISNLSCYTLGLMGMRPPTLIVSPKRA
jgi:arylsulfatase A-like enzyme